MEVETIKSNFGMSWEMKKLGDFVYIKTGKLDANASSIDGAYPFFTCSKEPLRIDTYSYNCECVLVAGNGDLNVKYYQGKFDAYQRTYIVESRDNKLLWTRYLYYFLDTYLEKLREQSIGGVIKYIKLENLTDAKIPLPPLPTQKRIAEILDAADALRRKDQELLKKYDELAQAIFIDMFGDPVKNEKGWEVDNLKNLIYPKEKISYGIVQPGDEVQNGIPVIRVGDFNLLGINKDNIRKVEETIEIKHKKTRLIGDEILIACVGSIGKIALADISLKGFNIVRATARVRVDEKKINRKFLAIYLSQPYIQNYFTSETRTVSQPTLNIKQIEETKIILPPIKLQEKFENIYNTLHKSSSVILKFKSNLLFNSLIQKAFKGELV